MLLKKSKALITRKFNDRVIVFTRTKIDCHRLCLFLKCLKLKVDELHGGLTQVQRLEKLNSFKDNSIDILVATDLAARGLDIDNVKTVINFTMPLTYKNYIHRVGRTARAQQSGRSISLVAESDRWLLKEIIKSSKEPVKCRVVPQDVIEHFRAKCETIRAEVGQLVNEEREESMLKDMETDISRAKNKLNKKPELAGQKRTWLKNVDYKTGQLKNQGVSRNKKKEQGDNKKSSEKRDNKSERNGKNGKVKPSSASSKGGSRNNKRERLSK